MQRAQTRARMEALEEQMQNPGVQAQMAQMQAVMQNPQIMQRMAELRVRNPSSEALLSTVFLHGGHQPLHSGLTIYTPAKLPSTCSMRVLGPQELPSHKTGTWAAGDRLASH